MRLVLLLILMLPLLATGCQTNRSSLHTVSRVDMTRYLGKWYQYAYYPNRFQPRDCGLTTAEYSPAGERIRVVNTCYHDAEGQSVNRRIAGKAWATDETNARLKVQFFWPFRGDYWIIDLDEDGYSYAVVGEPSRKFLWVLSREPWLDADVYEGIKQRLIENGYEPGRLVVTGRG